MPMTTATATSDTDLLRQMRAGAADAFEALYLRHQGPLFRFAVLRCGSAATAADVVQEVFMGLLTGSVKFDPMRGLLQNFLFGVARNLVMKHEQPRQRDAVLPDAGDGDDGDDGERAARLPALYCAAPSPVSAAPPGTATLARVTCQVASVILCPACNNTMLHTAADN